MNPSVLLLAMGKWVNHRADCVLLPWLTSQCMRKKLWIQTSFTPLKKNLLCVTSWLWWCDITPLAPTLHQFLWTISLLGRWSTSGSDRGIAHFLWLQEIQSREREKKNKWMKRTICLGLTQSARQGVMQHSAFPVCICKLTLAWISSKTSTKLLGMPTYPDWSSSLPWTSSHPTGLSAVRCWLPCPSSTAFFESLCPTPFSHSLTHFRSLWDL